MKYCISLLLACGMLACNLSSPAPSDMEALPAAPEKETPTETIREKLNKSVSSLIKLWEKDSIVYKPDTNDAKSIQLIFNCKELRSEAALTKKVSEAGYFCQFILSLVRDSFNVENVNFKVHLLDSTLKDSWGHVTAVLEKNQLTMLSAITKFQFQERQNELNGQKHSHFPNGEKILDDAIPYTDAVFEAVQLIGKKYQLVELEISNTDRNKHSYTCYFHYERGHLVASWGSEDSTKLKS